jgi:hypothetical protein
VSGNASALEASGKREDKMVVLPPADSPAAPADPSTPQPDNIDQKAKEVIEDDKPDLTLIAGERQQQGTPIPASATEQNYSGSPASSHHELKPNKASSSSIDRPWTVELYLSPGKKIDTDIGSSDNLQSDAELGSSFRLSHYCSLSFSFACQAQHFRGVSPRLRVRRGTIGLAVIINSQVPPLPQGRSCRAGWPLFLFINALMICSSRSGDKKPLKRFKKRAGDWR